MRRLIPPTAATDTCQPGADAPCGRCADCREEEARRFDRALQERLEAVARAARSVC